jgi:hypothetical protein
MESNLEQQVRIRAYELWLRDGMTNGRDSDHWYAAEGELLAQCAKTLPAATQDAAPKRKAKTAKTRKLA